MALDQLEDPTEQADRAQRLVAALPTCPIPELAGLGRTLHAWRLELLARSGIPTPATARPTTST